MSHSYLHTIAGELTRAADLYQLCDDRFISEAVRAAATDPALRSPSDLQILRETSRILLTLGDLYRQ